MTAERRLAAILFSDIKGFSARMGADEAGTFGLLQVHNRVIEQAVVRHQGRVVKTVGDAFMVEFQSSVGAVACALEIQAELAARNATASAGEQILVRIGVHAGDVIVEGGDLFGEAVNLAARLEPIAPVGGVCVTDEVFRQVRRRVPGRAERLGARTLKNIAETVDVVALYPGDGALDVEAPAPRAAARPTRLLAVAVAAVVVVAGAAAWLGWPGDAGPVGRVTIGYAGGLDGGRVGETFQGISRRITEILVESVVGPEGDEPGVLRHIDATTVEISLRPGVWFHPHPCTGPDGRPATVEDVRFSVERARDDRTTLPITAVAIEAGRVRLTLAHPSPYTALFLSEILLLPGELASCDPGPWLPGTGSFYVAEDSGSGVVTLSASPHPHRPNRPRIAEVVWRPILRPETAIADIARGDLDLYVLSPDGTLAVMDPTASRAALASPVPGVSAGILVSGVTQIFTHNVAVPVRPGAPLGDVRLRRAVGWAIDRDALRDLPWYGPARGRFLVPGLTGYDAHLVAYGHDPARVSALLAEAGFPGGEGLPELVLGSAPGRGAAADRIAAHLAIVGIRTRRVTLSSAEARRVFDDRPGETRPVDLFVGVNGTPVVDADPVGLISWAEGFGARVGSERLAELGREALAATDPALRPGVFARIEREVLDTALSIPLADASANVSGGPMVVYGARVAHWFDPVTGAWSEDTLDEVELANP